MFVYFHTDHGYKMVVKNVTFWISLFAVSFLVFCRAANNKSSQPSNSKVVRFTILLISLK